ncbi:MAG: thiamine-phosphate kinase [Gemmatimonadetes bacterium]|nr:MAG: thiamine-phosphate kinase [Gemmatimonadota bacterium]
MNLKTLGEFNFIDLIKEKAIVHPDHVITGIGDDSAIFQSDRNRVNAISTDTLVEGIHFVRDQVTPYDVGLKALAVTLSDLAAMGARPAHALMNLSVPPDIELAYLEQLFAGFYDLALIYNINLIGGDLTASRRDITISVTVVGDVSRRRALHRNGAQPGDKLLVTGTLGNSAAGQMLLSKSLEFTNESARERLIKAHTQPKPYIFEGEFIAESGCATSMIDISDGLSSDLNHIVNQSQVSAQIYASKLPSSDELRSFCDATGTNPLELLLHGGEEYSLLFSLKPVQADLFIASYQHRFNSHITVIGEIVEGYGMQLIDATGKSTEIEPAGWDHFAP